MAEWAGPFSALLQRARSKRLALGIMLTSGMLFLLFPAALPASAAGSSFMDRENDVAVYDWEAGRMYLDQDWDWADITQVDVTTNSNAVQVSARIVDLQPGYWTAAQVAFEVTGDTQEDFSLTWLPDGEWGLSKKQGWEDTGYEISCPGVSVQVDYSQKRVTGLVPRNCLANTASVAVHVSMYDKWGNYGTNCCYNYVLDSYPDAPGQYSSRVQYETSVSQPPPAYDPSGPAGTIYRLYRAYFLREPDKAGFDYWYGVYRNGYPLNKISNDFARSTEFQQRYGNLDNGGFLKRVYQNVLGRDPDPAGWDYWMDQMNRGMPRGYVMIYFSDSAEFRSKTADGRPPGY